MNISDETLSAFLDGELSRQERTEVEEAISTDPALADRLASLASADELVRVRASAIDSVPLPGSVTRLLQPDNVVSIAWWRRAGRQLREHAALAAAIALLIGFSAGQLFPGNPMYGDGSWQQAASHLDHIGSGESTVIGADTRLLSRFTFRDQQGRYCRQFLLESPEQVSENVACRSGGNWERIATVQTSGIADDYQPASGTHLLDSTLDELMQGRALGLEEEAALIRGQWADDSPARENPSPP